MINLILHYTGAILFIAALLWCLNLSSNPVKLGPRFIVVMGKNVMFIST